MTSEVEIAWAAGLFEGEGCFSHKGFAASFPRATMSMTDLDVLQHFQRVVGVGNLVKTRRKEKAHHKDQWQWYTVGEDEFHIVADMLCPYLHPRRVRAAKEAAEARKTYVAAVTAPRACEECGTLFETVFYKSKSRTKYCSDKCRFKARRDKYNSRIRTGSVAGPKKRSQVGRKAKERLKRAVFQPQRIKLPEDDAK